MFNKMTKTKLKQIIRKEMAGWLMGKEGAETFPLAAMLLIPFIKQIIATNQYIDLTTLQC